MTNRIVIGALSAGAMLLCADYTASSAETPRDVRSIVDNRNVLVGRRITIDGFLSRIDDYYFLSQGKRRPKGRLGDNGEEYWCNFSDAPSKLWFAAESSESGRLRKLIADDIGVGRHVIIRGVFYNETPGVGRDDVSPLLVLTGKEFSEQEIGPLRHVKIVKLFHERCNGTPGPARGTTQ